MDDSQNPQGASSDQSQQSPVQQQPQVQPPPAGGSQAPVSNPVREQAPIVVKPDSYDIKTEQEPTLQPELEKAGVEVSRNPENPKLTLEDIKAGFEVAKESTPVPSPSSQIMTQQQAAAVIKKGKFSDSITALAILLMRHFKQMLLQKQEGSSK